MAALGLNLVITVLHVVGLVKSDEGSSVWELLFREGVIYYLAAFTFNAVPAVSISKPFGDAALLTFRIV